MFRLFLVLFSVLLCARPALFAADGKQRAKEVRELAKQGSQAIPRMQEALKDAEPDVRLEAVRALVEVGTQYSLDPLVQALRDNDPEIQIRAADGLVNFYLPGYVQTGLTGSFRRLGTSVKTRFTDTNDQVVDALVPVRATVITALGRVVRGGTSMESRANAARALGILRGKAATPDLVHALRSKEDALIYESLVALQKIRDPQVAPQLTFLLRDPVERVQIAAIETTGLLLNRAALPSLRETLQETDNQKVRRAALDAIAHMADEQNRPIFERFYADADEKTRASAIEGIGRLRNPKDLLKLQSGFRDEKKMGARLSLAMALVYQQQLELSPLSPLQYLINTLNSKSFRGVAQAYLTELCRDEFVRKSVYPAIPQGTREEKMQLAQVLGASGGRDTLAVLDALTRDLDGEVAQEGVRALRLLKTRIS